MILGSFRDCEGKSVGNLKGAEGCVRGWKPSRRVRPGWKMARKKQSEMTELSCPLSSALTRAIMVGRPAGGSTHVSSEKGGVRFGKGQRLGNSHTKQERRREDERA